jgi:hypothetical protein
MAAAAPALTVLDVGHGSCAVLVEPNRTVVFDAGPKTGLLEFLRENGITTVDLVLISHADADHIRGVLGILAAKTIKVRAIRLNTDSEKGSRLWDDLLWVLNELQEAGETKFSPALTPADNGTFDSADVTIEILAPSAYLAGKGPKSEDRQGRRITTNSVSAVIKVSFKGVPVVLFTGDIDEIGLDDLIRSNGAMQAPFLSSPIMAGILVLRTWELSRRSSTIWSSQRRSCSRSVAASTELRYPRLLPLRAKQSRMCALVAPNSRITVPPRLPPRLRRISVRRSPQAGTNAIAAPDLSRSTSTVVKCHCRFMSNTRTS